MTMSGKVHSDKKESQADGNQSKQFFETAKETARTIGRGLQAAGKNLPKPVSAALDILDAVDAKSSYDKYKSKGHSTTASLLGAVSEYTAGGIVFSTGMAGVAAGASGPMILGVSLASQSGIAGEVAGSVTAKVVDEVYTAENIQRAHERFVGPEDLDFPDKTKNSSEFLAPHKKIGNKPSSKSSDSKKDKQKMQPQTILSSSVALPKEKNSVELFVIEKLKEVKKSVGDVNIIVLNQIKELKGTDKAISITPELKISLKFADMFHDGSEFAQQFSKLAVRFGGHGKTFQDIFVRAEGGKEFAAGFAGFMATGSPISFMQMLNGFFKMIDGFQSDMGSAFAEIQQALEELKRQLIKGFQELAKLVNNNTVVLLRRLYEINNKLDQLDKKMDAGFQTLHRQELIKTQDELFQEREGNRKLSADQLKENIQVLSRWIRIHSKASIQTLVPEDEEEAKISPQHRVDVLSSKHFDMQIMFPSFISQLCALVPHLLKEINPKDLPNLALLSQVSEVYMNSLLHFEFEDNHTSGVEDAKKIFAEVIRVIQTLENDKELLNCLFKQYETWSFQVGREILACLNPVHKKHNNFTLQQLGGIYETDQLKYALNEMEWRRLMLVRLCTLIEVPQEIQDKIAGMKSAHAILNQTKLHYDTEADKLISSVETGNVDQFQLALKHGADLQSCKRKLKSQVDLLLGGRNLPLGVPARFIIGQYGDLRKKSHWENRGTAPQMLHIYFKNLPKNVSQDNIIFQDIVTNREFGLLMLWCAQGYDIPDKSFAHPKSNWDLKLFQAFVKAMNKEKGILNKKSLREAYQAYKAYEDGLITSFENVNPVCLVWLVAILGNEEILNKIPKLKPEELQFIGGIQPNALAWFYNHNVSFLENLREKFGGSYHKQLDGMRTSDALVTLLVYRQHWELIKTAKSKIKLEGIPQEEKQIAAGLNKLAKSKTSAPKKVVKKKDSKEHKETFKPTNKETAERTIALLDLTATTLQHKTVKPSAVTHKDVPEKKESNDSSIQDQKIKELLILLDRCKTFYEYLSEDAAKIPVDQKRLRDEAIKQLHLAISTIHTIDKLFEESLLKDVPKTIKTLEDLHGAFNTLHATLKRVKDFKYSLSKEVSNLIKNLKKVIQKLKNGLEINDEPKSVTQKPGSSQNAKFFKTEPNSPIVSKDMMDEQLSDKKSEALPSDFKKDQQKELSPHVKNSLLGKNNTSLKSEIVSSVKNPNGESQAVNLEHKKA